MSGMVQCFRCKSWVNQNSLTTGGCPYCSGGSILSDGIYIINEPSENYISELISALSQLDCGDNSCMFATPKDGMRTNGGCRCLSMLPLAVRIAIEKIWLSNKKGVK
ncbi:MAG TPA: hypothetical protein PK151_05140 [Caldisericia bacterium]|nr:hypothetical protein [Caldisericia bacterium]